MRRRRVKELVRARELPSAHQVRELKALRAWAVPLGDTSKFQVHTGLKEFLAPDEEARWKRAVETKMGEAKGHELPAEVAWSLLAQVLAESRLRTADSNLRRWLRLLQE